MRATDGDDGRACGCGGSQDVLCASRFADRIELFHWVQDDVEARRNVHLIQPLPGLVGFTANGVQPSASDTARRNERKVRPPVQIGT